MRFRLVGEAMQRGMSARSAAEEAERAMDYIRTGDLPKPPPDDTSLAKMPIPAEEPPQDVKDALRAFVGWACEAWDREQKAAFARLSEPAPPPPPETNWWKDLVREVRGVS